MKTRITTIFTTLILTFTTVYGQKYEPLELAKKIFAKETLPNIENYISGEYDGKPNGKDLQNGSITKFALLGQTDKTAVVGMTVLDSIGRGLDTYLHFEKDTSWKMTAFRALAMTGMIEQIKIELEKMTPQQVNEMIEKSKKNKNDDFEMFKSREDYNFQLGNTKLTLELDENIINHFLTNQAEFERLKNLALIQLEKEKVVFKEEPVSTWTRLKPLLYLAAMFVGAALIIRVASTDHKPAAVDEVAVTEVDTEVVSDEMLDVALDRAMLDDYSLYVYLSDASVE